MGKEGNRERKRGGVKQNEGVAFFEQSPLDLKKCLKMGVPTSLEPQLMSIKVIYSFFGC